MGFTLEPSSALENSEASPEFLLLFYFGYIGSIVTVLLSNPFQCDFYNYIREQVKKGILEGSLLDHCEDHPQLEYGFTGLCGVGLRRRK